MTVAGLLLAAGAGRRYGCPKALVRHGGGLLVDRGLRILRDAGCTPTVVVLGAAAAEVRAAAHLDGARVVDNDDWATGMGSSLRAGLAALAGGTRSTVDSDGVVAVVVILVDQLRLTAAAIRRVAADAVPADLVMAGYPDGPVGDRRGHPVLLGRDHWAGVAAAAIGDVGARPYLRAHADRVRVVPCGDVADDADQDVPEGVSGA
ncbi:NTP transferase domain-containing protein [Micromonospora sp. NPDC023956]|uniref:nucleotidyltransferase family protein n=1 Tax=Micromonospora sp. NPDC023956 TaxID=3155722 RepID=UPI0033C9D93A